MAQHSDIEWTDGTWTVVQGCDYESPGCTHCYVPRVLHRLAANPNPKISAPMQGLTRKTDKGDIVFTGKVALREDRLTWPLEWKKPSRIFVPSHGDPFHPAVPDEFIDLMFAVMALSPRHTYQVLTKRGDRMRRYMPAIGNGDKERWARALQTFAGMKGPLDLGEALEFLTRRGPLTNVWLGVSVEDQKRADERIPQLLATPAAVRFLSCEPLLGPVDLTNLDHTGDCVREQKHGINALWDTSIRPRIDWVICGGESGPEARPMHPDWARSLRDQCNAAGVPFFFKQWGEWGPYDRGGVDSKMLASPGAFDEPFQRFGKRLSGRLLDGRTWNEMPGGVA